MQPAAQIARYNDALKKHADVTRFRLFLSEQQAIDVGFTKQTVVGIYQPATQNQHIVLNYAIELADGRIAYGKTHPASSDPKMLINLAKTTAAPSEEPLILSPATSADPLPPLISTPGRPNGLLPALTKQASALRTALLATKAKSFEGELSAIYSNSAYLDSNGLTLESEAIRFAGRYEVNGALETSFSTRQADTVTPVLLERVAGLTDFGNALEASPTVLKKKRLPIFLANGTDLVDTFLLSQLAGNSILDGSSRFKTEDFTKHTAVAHAGFNLPFDQTRPMHQHSIRFDGQGLTGQKYDLIKDGKLTEPFCDLKSATRLGFSPRIGESSSRVALTDLPDFADISTETDSFILAFHALGVHTQNKFLGTYSLPCADSLYFEKGKLVGPVSPVITGNFFDVLKDKKTCLVRHPLFSAPMLTFVTDLTV